jgi:hypothetical protein
VSYRTIQWWTCDAEGCGLVVEDLPTDWFRVEVKYFDDPRLMTRELSFCPAHGLDVREAYRRLTSPGEAGKS